jgi:hypothetical protein
MEGGASTDDNQRSGRGETTTMMCPSARQGKMAHPGPLRCAAATGARAGDAARAALLVCCCSQLVPGARMPTPGGQAEAAAQQLRPSHLPRLARPHPSHLLITYVLFCSLRLEEPRSPPPRRCCGGYPSWRQPMPRAPAAHPLSLSPRQTLVIISKHALGSRVAGQVRMESMPFPQFIPAPFLLLI